MRNPHYACEGYTGSLEDRDQGLHIGQTMIRLEFLFRGHADQGLTDGEGWLACLRRPGMSVVAESGYTVDLAEWWTGITLRPADVGGPHRMRPRWQGRPRQGRVDRRAQASVREL